MHAHPEFFATVAGQILALVALGYALGRLMRLGGLPALGWGAHALFSATYLSYEICRAFGVPLAAFPLLTAGFIAIAVPVLRRHLPRPPPGVPRDWMLLPAVAVLALALIWFRTLSGFSPNASAQFFQAWDPLFVKASLAQGSYLAVESMSLGDGFLTSALHYAPNARGVLTLLGLGGSGDLYASYVAAGTFALIAGLAVLVDALKRSLVGVALFVFLFLLFAASYQPLTNHLFGASSDELLFFAAALAAHALFAEPSRSAVERLGPAFAALAIGVSGRNYGAFFALALLAAFVPAVWRRPAVIRPAAPFLILGAVLVSVEVTRLCLAGNLYYPRVRLPELFPWSLDRFAWGSLCDWGLLYERAPGDHGPSVLGTYLVLLAVAAGYCLRSRRADQIAPLFAPLVFFLLPLLLELVSGFRKDVAYSKIYFGSAWLFAWLPAYVVLRLGAIPPVASRIRPLALARVLAAVVAGSLGAVFLRGYGEGYYRVLSAGEFRTKVGRWWDEQSSGIDESIARKAVARGQDGGAHGISGKRVMYFHYEPGIGLRWYLGGDFFRDLDFWSRPVQDRLRPDAGVVELLEQFDRPILYLSLGPRPAYQNFVSYPHHARLWRELQAWRELDCFRHVIEQDGALLLIP